MAVASLRCLRDIRTKVRHYLAMCYGQLVCTTHSFVATRECAPHHTGGPSAEEVCYLHGASSLDSVSS